MNQQRMARVLVVDDDAEIVRMLHDYLKRDFEVITAGDGAEALKLLEQAPVDAVLADHMMPGLTGIAMLEKAAELRPDAERSVRRALLLEAIAAREELTVSEADVDAEVARLARDSGRAPQAIRSMLERGNELDGLRLTLREAKTLALLIEHAQIEPAAETVGGKGAQSSQSE